MNSCSPKSWQQVLGIDISSPGVLAKIGIESLKRLYEIYLIKKRNFQGDD